MSETSKRIINSYCFCPDAMKRKLRFKSQNDALRYNQLKNKKNNTDIRLTAYYCGCCKGWHLTSLETGVYKRKIIKTKQYNGTTSKTKHNR